MKKLLVRAVILLFTMIIIVSFLIINLYSARPVMGLKISKVVIDAGHGTPDGGALGTVSGVRECDLNLSVAKLLERKLKEGGIEVIMTRRDAKSVYANPSASLRENYLNDLKKRVSIANESGAEAFISIHMNHFPDSSCSGPQIFYSANIKGTESLAQNIRQGFIDNIGENCEREIKPVTTELYLLRESNIPALIIECGFLSNPAEEALLCDKEYMSKLADSIASGILNSCS